MAKMNKNTKHPVATFVALGIIGVASSCTFVFTAFAAGMAPADVITLANNSRAKATLTPLSENAKLREAAKSKADDMIKNDYFAHTSPKGVEPWYWIKQAGYQYKAAGENLAINYTDAREQHEAWMKSETHRANIMSTRYQDIGVAVVKGKIDGKESVVTVEFFGTPLVGVADQVAPAPPIAAPAPVEIKGAETEVSAPLQEESVKLEEQVLPDASEQAVMPIAPIRPVLPELTPDAMWLSLAWAAVLALCAFIAPLLFISRAYEVLMQKSEKKVVVKVVKREEVPEQAMPPLASIDGIHKALVHERA